MISFHARTLPVLTLLVLKAISFYSPPATAEEVWKKYEVELATEIAFTEGPVWHPDGKVYFCDGFNDRIIEHVPGQWYKVYRDKIGTPSGLAYDPQGRLLICGYSSRAVKRIEPDGTVTLLATTFEGKRFNSPNDLVLDRDGRIYFTDPRYGGEDGIEMLDPAGRRIEGVYRLDPDGTVTRLIAHEVDRPNGIALSPDERFLYLADNVSDNVSRNRGRPNANKLWRFDFDADKGTVNINSGKVIFDWGSERGPDGMCVDIEGLIYVAAGFNVSYGPEATTHLFKAGIYIFNSEGTIKGFIPVPGDMITNCTFGDKDRKTLYITSGHRLWRVRVDTPGHALYPEVKRE